MKKILFTIAMGGLFTTSHLKAQVVLEALEGGIPFTPSAKCLERVYDKHYGDGIHNYIYCAVQGPNGKKWLNLNLGAEYAKESSPHFNPEAVPTDYNDWKAFGSLFQRGRRADGHELVTYSEGTDGYWYVDRKYPRTSVKQVDPYTSNNSYVYGVVAEDWTTNFVNLWDSSDPVKYAQNPCPNGYELASQDDFLALMKDGGVVNYNIEILGKMSTTSIFTNRDYPDLYLMTAPPSIHNMAQGSEKTQARVYNEDNVHNYNIGTSSLWTTGIEQGSKAVYGYYDVFSSGASGLDVFWQGSLPLSSEIGYLDYGIYPGGVNLFNYGFAYGYKEHSEPRVTAGRYFSYAIRCVEK